MEKTLQETLNAVHAYMKESVADGYDADELMSALELLAEQEGDSTLREALEVTRLRNGSTIH